MCNEANEMCRDLGRYNYLYKPHIKIEVLSDGTKVPVVICKAHPHRDKDFYNEFDLRGFEDKVYLI